MYTAKIENSGGEVLELTGREDRWQVVSITGLNPPKATINVTNIAGMDGARFNSAKLNVRNLVITLKLNSAPGFDVEENRLTLYDFFRTKDDCIFYYANATRNVKIEGYVESVECDLFSSGEVMQISILCLYPYFRSVAEIIADISHEMAGFVFPFTINLNSPIAFSTYEAEKEVSLVNSADVEAGAIIQIDFLGAVSKVRIENTGTGEFMTVSGSYAEGDRIVIDTNRGQKKIALIHGGIESNIFSQLARGSTFFQLRPGINTFTYAADDGESDADAFVTFAYSTLYRGV